MRDTAGLELRAASRGPAGARERSRRAEALRSYRKDSLAQDLASGDELSYLRAQLQVASRLTARLAETNDINEMVELVVDELQGTSRSTSQRSSAWIPTERCVWSPDAARSPR